MVIDYEKLVADYMQGLYTKLRKFSPAEDFLDLWVHDEDHTTSILNMAESAESFGLGSFSIRIQSEEVMSYLDLDRLTNQLNHFARVSTRKEDGSLYIDIQFSRQAALATLEVQQIPVQYRLAFNYNSGESNFEKPLKKETHFVFAESSLEGVTLQANIDPQTHFVQEVSFTGSTTEASRKLMNELCSLLINKPVNECHDHAIIRLEYELRDKSQKRTNPGITMPSNSWEVFKKLTGLIRNLMGAYRKETGFQDTTNFYSPMMSAEWREASDMEKKNRLTPALKEFCRLHKLDSESVLVKEIQHQTKIVLNTSPNLCKNDSTQLMELEAFLRKTVEKTISLYNKEEPDLNQMRWDRPAVKSQAPVLKIIKLKGGVS